MKGRKGDDAKSVPHAARHSCTRENYALVGTEATAEPKKGKENAEANKKNCTNRWPRERTDDNSTANSQKAAEGCGADKGETMEGKW